MSKKELELAHAMLEAVMDVLEQHDIPSKYYVELFGSIMDEQAVSILQQEQQAAE